MPTRITLALIGAALLLVGVFCPFITAPIVGSVTLFNTGRGDGVILLVLAVLGAVLALLRRPAWNWVVAGAAGGLLAFTSLHLLLSVTGMREAMAVGSGNALGDALGQAMSGSVQVSFGLPVLMLGVIVLGVSAALRAAPQPAQENRKSAGIPLMLAGVALLLAGTAAGAVVGQQERTAVVQKAKAAAAQRAVDEQRRQEAAAAEQAARDEEVRQQEAAAAAETAAKSTAINNLKLESWKWESTEFSKSLVGTVLNNSDRNITFVRIKFDVLDADDNKLGEADDIVESLAPGERWKFSAGVYEDEPHSARLNEITGEVADATD